MEIEITSQNQEQQTISFDDLISPYPYTILYFYPKDNTPGCTLEAQDFRKLKTDFEKLGAQIIGVSKDSYKSHCKFIQNYELNFQLVSDTDLTLHHQFQTLGEKSMYGKKYTGTIRSTFLIDHAGTIIEERRNISAIDHAKKVLEKTQEVVMGKG